MAEDITPALLEAIRADFNVALAEIEAEAATWPQAYDYASKVGKALTKALQKNFTSATLPNGQCYWNIADRVLRPMLEQDYSLVAEVAANVQQQLNAAAGLGLKAQTAVMDDDRVDGILNLAASAEDYDTVAGQVSSAVENFSLHTVDDTIERNAEFQYSTGLKPKIVRKAARGCCRWCSALAGTYTYPDTPKDVYRRHENCNCTVEYDPDDGRRQNVHTKQWTSADATAQREKVQQNLRKAGLRQQAQSDTIKKTKYAPSPQRNFSGIQVTSKKYAQLCGTMNTQYPNLRPEDGARVIRDSQYLYRVVADGYGGAIIKSRTKLK